MKSHASDLLRLVAAVYKDAAAKCRIDELEIRLDLETIRRRVEQEGLSFLTITLPDLCSDFEACLASGLVDPLLFRAFKCPRKQRKTPVFLRGFFDLVFDKEEGRLHDKPNIEAIRAIRQICRLFKKLKLPCSPQRERKAVIGFKTDEQDLNEDLDPADIESFDSFVGLFWDYVFSHADMEQLLDFIPKHGPGSTVGHVIGNNKYVFKQWYERCERYFPFHCYGVSSATVAWSHGTPIPWHVKLVSEEQEEPVKVTFVPKTLKTPRVIALETVAKQYLQQSVSFRLIPFLEDNPVTGGHINFSSQEINRRLALKSSSSGQQATLDMSAASDRVPFVHAIKMFNYVPFLKGAIEACRTKRASIPKVEDFSEREVLTLRKFASMGSALCFPVEAMYFYTLCVKALMEKYDLPYTPEAMKQCASKVYVYGDDLIVPVEDVQEIIGSLQKYYCKVSSAKSFWTGKFRESCGMDAYDGVEVTPIYVRMPPPDSQWDSSSIISFVESGNMLNKWGYPTAASAMFNMAEKALGGKLPMVGETCGGLGVVTSSLLLPSDLYNERYDPWLQRPEVLTWVPTPVYQKDTLTGYPALLKCLLRLEIADVDTQDGWRKPFELKLLEMAQMDEQHLLRTTRFGTVTLKRRWVYPH